VRYLLLGDDSYLVSRLEGEKDKDKAKQPGSWSSYLDEAILEALLTAYKGNKNPDRELRLRAIERLSFLYWSRSCYLRTQRAREELRADYLNQLTLVLAILLLLLLEVICISVNGDYWNHSSPSFWDIVHLRLDLHNELIREALVATMTGALGSTLSGFYKLRDEDGGIAMLRSFRSAMWAQPFVGATVGMLLMLFLVSGILTLATGSPTIGTSVTPNWIILGIYCFIAGFSEPFFLGVVARVAGAADKKTTGDVNAGSRPNNKPT
jgi:hypothetical protein